MSRERLHPYVEIQPTLAWLQPEGNFTHQAALEQQQRSNIDYELVACPSIKETIAKVQRNEVTHCIVPADNAIIGDVNVTYDALINDDELFIKNQEIVPVELYAYWQPGTIDFAGIWTKEEARGQCQPFLERVFPNILHVNTNSTGESVAFAAEHPGIVAIGSSIAREAQGIPQEKLIKYGPIQTQEGNATSFYILSKDTSIPEPTGKDTTTLVMNIQDESGSLLHALQSLAENNINLTKIKSHGRREDGTISFLISIDGHQYDPEVQNALANIQEMASVKIKGSYPKADYTPPAEQEDVNMEAAIKTIREQAKNGQIDHERDAIAIFTLPNKQGSLAGALALFAERGINLTDIDSLPSGRMNEYIFRIAFENHLPNKGQLIQALAEYSGPDAKTYLFAHGS